MIEKVKAPCPPCKNAVIPCDYGDEVSLMEQIAKYKQELKDTIASYKKEIEGLVTGLEDLNEKVKTLEQADAELNSQLGDKLDKKYGNGAEGSVYVAKKDIQTLIDVSTTPEKGKIPIYDQGGTLKVDNGMDDSDAVTKRQLDLAVNETYQQLDGKKADIIPKPASGTLLYGISADSQRAQPFGVKSSTYGMNKFEVVQRTDNGQINLPDQVAFPPSDTQAINKATMNAAQQQLIEQFTIILKTKRDLLTFVPRGQTFLYSVNGTGDLLNPAKQASVQASVVPSADSVPIRNDRGAIETFAAENDNECVNKEQMDTALADKVDVIPKPASNTLLYGVDSSAATDEPVGFVASQTVVTHGVIPIRTANGQIKAPDQSYFIPGAREYIARQFADSHYLKQTITSSFCKHTAGSYDVTMTRAASSSETGTDKIRDQSIYIIQAYKEDGNLAEFTINANKTLKATMALLFCDSGDYTLGFAFTGSALITDIAKAFSRIQSIVPPSGARIAYYRVALDN